MANEYLLSPAALDPYRIGKAINEGYSKRLDIPITSDLVENVKKMMGQFKAM